MASRSNPTIRTNQRWLAAIQNPNQLYWLVHFIFATVVVSISIPYFRVYPEIVHVFCRDHLYPWQTSLLIFAVSTGTIAIAFRLFSPRVRHLRWPLVHPPIWLAWLLPILLFCAADIRRLSHDRWASFKGYDANFFDWAFYFFLPLFLVALWHSFHLKEQVGSVATLPKSTQFGDAEWSSVAEWLRDEGCPANDAFGHLAFAEKLVDRLLRDSRSIGLIGGFGAGKSTIIEWVHGIIQSRVNEDERAKGGRVFWVRQSCWGYESSSLAIQQILRAAIAEVEKEVDTFYIRSLPETYRQTFAAGGDWVGAMVEIFIGRKDSFEQFEQLSALLEQTNSRLVLIIEDLDRNETQSFSIQDVCAFLYRLRQYDRLQFILAADTRSASVIDFRKLTDHIEYVPMVDVDSIHRLITRVHCEAMEHIHPSRRRDTAEHLNEFSSTATYMLSGFRTQPIARAVVELLRTPRTLRLAVRRTHYAWSDHLRGEVDWVELFLVNVLRVAAPEAFRFLYDNRNRLLLHSSETNSSASRSALLERWRMCSEGCDWSSEAAEAVIMRLFPEAVQVFQDTTGIHQNFPISIRNDRYWARVLNERIPESEIPDRVVLDDIEAWKASRAPNERLVTQLVDSRSYAATFECVYQSLLVGENQALLELFEQVIETTSNRYGNEAASGSTGLASLVSIVPRHFSLDHAMINWIEAQVRVACRRSLGIVYALNQLWSWSGRSAEATQSLELMQRTSVILRDEIQEYRQLFSVIGRHERVRTTLSDLVFKNADAVAYDNGRIIQGAMLIGVDWRWLGPILLPGLSEGNARAVTITLSLTLHREGRRLANPLRLDANLIAYFFPESAEHVTQLLRVHANNPEILLQLDPYDQDLLREIANVDS